LEELPVDWDEEEVVCGDRISFTSALHTFTVRKSSVQQQLKAQIKLSLFNEENSDKTPTR